MREGGDQPVGGPFADCWMNWVTELVKSLPVAADPGLHEVERWLRARGLFFPLWRALVGFPAPT